MKQNAKTSRAVEQLEKMLRVFNQHCFKGEFPETIIRLKKTQPAYDRITCSTLWSYLQSPTTKASHARIYTPSNTKTAPKKATLSRWMLFESKLKKENYYDY